LSLVGGDEEENEVEEDEEVGVGKGKEKEVEDAELIGDEYDTFELCGRTGDDVSDEDVDVDTSADLDNVMPSCGEGGDVFKRRSSVDEEENDTDGISSTLKDG